MRDKATFGDLTLDEDGLHIPQGTMALADLTRAEFVRDIVKEHDGATTTETSAGAVVGGAVVGAAVFGAVGAIAGAALGSTVDDEVEGPATYATNSVQLIFETASASYREDIAREDEMDAYHFAKKVEHAIAHQG